jgi:hypothetical protein
MGQIWVRRSRTGIALRQRNWSGSRRHSPGRLLGLAPAAPYPESGGTLVPPGGHKVLPLKKERWTRGNN